MDSTLMSNEKQKRNSRLYPVKANKVPLPLIHKGFQTCKTNYRDDGFVLLNRDFDTRSNFS